MTYFFLLGTTPEFSFAELERVLGASKLQRISNQFVATEFENDEQAIQFFNTLGGSVKLLKHEGEFSDLTQETLHKYVVAYLAQTPRPTFAIAEFNRDKEPKIHTDEVKQDLKKRDIGSRFIEGVRSGLTAAILLHHPGIIELNIIQKDQTTYFAKTLAVQDIDNWTVRDREKPYADRKKGMLPPKVARVMVNIAISTQLHQQKIFSIEKYLQDHQYSLYDPFCGSGTVLIEALVRSCEVIASDLDPVSVKGTQANVEWFKNKTQIDLPAIVFHSDVAAVSPSQVKKAVQLLVTEPFLGKPKPQSAQLANIFKGLEKLYLGSFKQWTRILDKQAVVVMIFPYVQDGRQVFSLENMIDKLSQFGYTPVFEPVLYHRPQAVVQRQIWTFQYSQK
jgi:tRNA G10  N-methylase Trm11